MSSDNYLKKELFDIIKSDNNIFEFIQEVCLDGMWYWDLEKPENEWMNKRFWDVLGYDYAEMPDSPLAWQGIINQNDLKVAVENFNSHLANENFPYDQIVRYTHKNGSTVWIRCFGKAIRDTNGKPLRMLGVHNNITDLKKAVENAEKSNRVKSEFLANMSHEIRTPMNGVLGMTELVYQTELNATQKSYLGHIKKSADNLLTIINDILDISKLESGKFELELVEFDLDELSDNILRLLSVNAHKKNIEVVYFKDKDIPGYFIGDELRIRQILINLIGNAIKFTDNGEVFFDIKNRGQADDVYELEFSVRDTGIGMSDEVLKNLFKPFVQGDLSYTKKYQGTGLGLAISADLIKVMKGEISVKSEVGKGSEFSFKIKLRSSSSKLDKKEFVDIDNPETTKYKNKILIVEDNEINRLVLIEMIKREFDGEIITAENGEEAIEKYDSENPDIIFLDIQLPIFSGYEVYDKIIEMSNLKARKKPKVIAITAYAMKQDEERCLQAGMDFYLSKPIKLKSITELLAKFIDKN